VRDRRLVLYRIDLKACGLQGTNGGFATRSGPLDHNIDLLHSMILYLLRNLLCSHLSSERS